MSSFVGIDPGKSGCFCLLTKEGSIRFADWPKDDNLMQYYAKLTNIVQTQDVKLCILERVHAMPKQGVSSMFTFGMNFGLWQGWLMSWNISYLLVAPQTWMKGLVSKADGGDPKKRVGTVAQRMFPHAELYGPKGGYKDGRADSLMMAYYAMLQSPEGGRINV
jgi:crossover junction endodeoxyribonuclease RuvC